MRMYANSSGSIKCAVMIYLLHISYDAIDLCISKMQLLFCSPLQLPHTVGVW